ncbi:phosphoribosylformylglycinamidine synthase I [Candidatus Peregrinibacteria bacterium]|nr:phosphoribosylformylglycinamidine synthase I [Candidatus Peregrinibacteria bacterium]
MVKPKVIVITGYGINSEEETAKSFEKAGAAAEIVHINDLIGNPKKINNYQILAFPGGFAYGDDTGSGNALANKIKNNIQNEILKFIAKDRLVIGICNGFQILTNIGLLPGVLMHNNTARLECRWVWLKNTSQKCIWTRDINLIHLPIAHGEGNFYAPPEMLKKMKQHDQIAFKYVNENGSPADRKFPINPNGAMEDIAGICDPTGRIFGMMPHPERFFSFENEDGWELKKEKLIRENKPLPKEGDGLKIFRNAVEYFNS